MFSLYNGASPVDLKYNSFNFIVNSEHEIWDNLPLRGSVQHSQKIILFIFVKSILFIHNFELLSEKKMNISQHENSCMNMFSFFIMRNLVSSTISDIPVL